MFDLVGVWRLKSSYFIAQETGDRLEIFDQESVGYAVFDPHGRMVVLMTSGGRTPASSSEDMAALYKSMVAYTGKWSIDGEKFSTHVDAAWDPAWVRTEQVRFYAFDGSTLTLRTAPLEHPAFPGQQVVGYVDWEREN